MEHITLLEKKLDELQWQPVLVEQNFSEKNEFVGNYQKIITIGTIEKPSIKIADGSKIRNKPPYFFEIIPYNGMVIEDTLSADGKKTISQSSSLEKFPIISYDFSIEDSIIQKDDRENEQKIYHGQGLKEKISEEYSLDVDPSDIDMFDLYSKISEYNKKQR